MADAITGRTAHPEDGLDVIDEPAPRANQAASSQEQLTLEGRSQVPVDLSERPERARKYGVAVVPTIVALHADGTVVRRFAP